MMKKLVPPALVFTVLVLASCSATPSVTPEPVSSEASTTQKTAPTATASEPDVTVSAMWAFDVTSIDEIRKHADLLVAAEVTTVADRATFAVPGSGMPYTEVGLRIDDVLKGAPPKSDFTALYAGGTVTLQQVLNDSQKESAEKSGVTELTRDELSQRTQTYAYDEHVELVPGSKYVLALGRNEDGTYTIGPAGFAVFHLDGETLVNDITGSKYAYGDLRG